MNSCVFFHRWTHLSDGLHYLVLHFPARPLSGLVGDFASPSIVFTPALWQVWHLPIGFVLFHKVHYKHLGLLVKTWVIHSIFEGSPFRYYLSDIFPEVVPKLLADFLSLETCAQAPEVFLPSNILGILRSFLWVALLLCSRLAGFFGSLFSQIFPCFLGDPKLLEGLIHACEQCPGQSSPWILVSWFGYEEDRLGYIPYSTKVLLWWPPFLSIL